MVNREGKSESDTSVLDELEDHFKGSNIHDELKRLKSDAAGFKIFLTSATGFYAKNGNQLENYYSGNDDPKKWLADEEAWDPIGVTDPFFWIFNQNEDRYFPKKSKFL